jgi:hypothetical protein
LVFDRPITIEAFSTLGGAPVVHVLFRDRGRLAIFTASFFEYSR